MSNEQGASMGLWHGMVYIPIVAEGQTTQGLVINFGPHYQIWTYYRLCTVATDCDTPQTE